MASPDTSSGRATKADMAELKRQAKENEQAYKQGLEDASSPGNGDGNGEKGNGSPTGPVPSPRTVYSMLSTDAQKVIVVSMTIVVVVALIEQAHSPAGKKDNSQGSFGSIIVGGFISGGLLLGMSYFLPEFASGLAITAMLVTILEKGKPFWDIAQSVTKNPSPIAPSQTATPTSQSGSSQAQLIPSAPTNQPRLV